MIVPDEQLWISGEESLAEHLERRGVSRRAFLAFCSTMAAVLSAAPAAAAGPGGGPAISAETVAEGLGAVRRPVLVWLQLQECTGCLESVLRAGGTTVEEVVLNLVSLDYNELLMASAGRSAEAALEEATAGEHILVVNGSVPRGLDGAYTTIGGRSAEEVLRSAARTATSVFAVGACAHWGSVQASHPNPTGAVGVDRIVTDRPVVNIAGCPPIGEVVVASLVHTLSFGAPPPVDGQGRPRFAYGNRVHDACPRRARYDAGQFVVRFDDAAAREGHCLYQVGCRGPETFSPCPVIQWNLRTDWPVGAGHPCIGCTEPQFYDRFTPFYDVLPAVGAPGIGVEATAETLGIVGLGAVGAGIAAHAAASTIWARRASRAAGRVRLPLLGDVETHEAAPSSGVPSSGVPSSGAPAAADATDAGPGGGDSTRREERP